MLSSAPHGPFIFSFIFSLIIYIWVQRSSFPQVTIDCCCLVARLWPTLCSPMDCSPPGFSVHGISQTSGLPFPSPRDLLNPRIESASPALAGRFFTTEPRRWPRITAMPTHENWGPTLGLTVWSQSGEVGEGLWRPHVTTAWSNHYLVTAADVWRSCTASSSDFPRDSGSLKFYVKATHF